MNLMLNRKVMYLDPVSRFLSQALLRMKKGDRVADVGCKHTNELSYGQ